jgi:hypothetical protein
VLGTTGARLPDFELEVCIWERDPRFAPSSCSTVIIDTKQLLGIPIETKTDASLGEFIPERVIVSTAKIQTGG